MLALEKKYDECEKVYLKALAIDPGHFDTLRNLGIIYLESRKDLKAAERYLKKALTLAPDNIDLMNNLGVVYLELYKDRKADLQLAESLFRKVLSIDPMYLNGLINLAYVFLQREKLGESKSLYLKACALSPGNVNVLQSLGVVCSLRDEYDEAVGYLKKAREIAPEDMYVISNLALSLYSNGNRQETIQLVHEIMKMPAPGIALCYAFIFSGSFYLGEYIKKIKDDVVSLLLQGSLDLRTYRMIALSLLATPGLETSTIYDIHLRIGEMIKKELKNPPFSTYENTVMPPERLKIGYLSPDFRRHAVNTFVKGVISSHDKSGFEVYCYSSALHEDEITEQYKASVDCFRSVTQLSDDDLARQIHADGIHILVDLTGYTLNTRIDVLSYQPAPVQIMYLGYPYTSGMHSVDYFFSDPYLDTPENARYFVEKQLILPESFISLDGFNEQVIDEILPVERNGFITFGSLNNIYKLNSELVATWCRILKMIPGSRMIINHPNASPEVTHGNIMAEFSGNGIEPHRIGIVWEKHPEGSHLRYYNDIDIVLDTFPLTGGTTTVDALWMGVPVVTLVGEIYYKRLSYSVLKNLGMDMNDTIAFSVDEYVMKTVALANDLDRLRALHKAIPRSLRNSILCDPIRLARHMETAYKEAWNNKFQGYPVEVRYAEPAAFIPLRCGGEIGISGSLDDLETYVLQEQGGWLDAEYDFFLTQARSGMRVLDIGAGIGVYSIPLALKLGQAGKLWAATGTPGEARYLVAGISRNELKNVEILVSGDRKLNLDYEMARHDLNNIDLVRLHLNAGERDVLLEAATLFSQNSPLVMFGIRPDDSTSGTAFSNLFRAWGYDLFCLAPGQGVLVPFESGNQLDVFSLNLFACKPETAESLARQGSLVRRVVPVVEFPGIDNTVWQEYLRSLVFSSSLTNDWAREISKQPEWEAYWVALNLYALAKDLKRSGEDRYAFLTTSRGILLMLSQAQPTLPRLLSLSRVCSDMGKREAAVSVLNQIYAILDSGREVSLSEPFLALSGNYEVVDPGGCLREWLVSMVLEYRDKLSGFSSYFTGRVSLEILETVKNTGFQSNETERRINLIRRRYGIDE